MRVLVVMGTRPEVIKLAPLVKALSAADGFEVRCCVTSQHKDLLRPMLDFFQLHCDYDLQVMTPGQTLAAVTNKILEGVSRILRQDPVDLIVVQGDTTTAFAGALAAFYERVRIAHVEAGLRSYNLDHPYPEEANRRFIDVVADYLLVPTEQSRHNLMREGTDPAKVFITGNTGIDALMLARELVGREGRKLPLEVGPGERFVLVTAHRRESFGAPLERVFKAVVEITRRHPEAHVLLPLHPNPHVRSAAAAILAGVPRIHLVEPLEYPDFVRAMEAADLILTDSGGVQEEAPSLGKPVLVLREATERPEAVAAGAAELVGTDLLRIINAASIHLRRSALPRPAMHLYGDGLASTRIVEVLRHGSLQKPFRANASRQAA